MLTYKIKNVNKNLRPLDVGESINMEASFVVQLSNEMRSYFCLSVCVCVWSSERVCLTSSDYYSGGTYRYFSRGLSITLT